MLNKNIALTDNYGDMIRFIAEKIEEPVTKQYLESCPKNTTYVSNTSAEMLLDAMNFYFEQRTLKDVTSALFLSLYADV